MHAHPEGPERRDDRGEDGLRRRLGIRRSQCRCEDPCMSRRVQVATRFCLTNPIRPASGLFRVWLRPAASTNQQDLPASPSLPSREIPRSRACASVFRQSLIVVVANARRYTQAEQREAWGCWASPPSRVPCPYAAVGGRACHVAPHRTHSLRPYSLMLR